MFRRGDNDWPEGRFHLIVAVGAVAPDGSLLMTQRAATKAFPLVWEFPGGSAVVGEASPEAAARELGEETGLEVSPEGLVHVGQLTESSALLDMFVVAASREAVLELDPVEVYDAARVEPGGVEQRLACGHMAAPWTARLEALWTGILRDADSVPTAEPIMHIMSLHPNPSASRGLP